MDDLKGTAAAAAGAVKDAAKTAVDAVSGAVSDAADVVAGAAEAVAGTGAAAATAAKETAKDVAEHAAKVVTGHSLAPLPATRPELLALHRDLRRRRDAAPLMSEERAHLAAEIGRVEVEVARIERAMDPPRV